MHILHGTWQAHSQRFILWGEDTGIEPEYRKGRRGKTAPHPYVMQTDSLLRYLTQYATDAEPDGDKVVIWLPGVYKQPSPSIVARRNGAILTDTHPELLAWELDALILNVTDALDFLLQVPDVNHGMFRLGHDLQFWQQATLLAMNCLIEGRYIPAMSQQGKQFRAYWQARPDDALAQQLAQHMPGLCRAIVDAPENAENSGYMLNHFLSNAVDTFVREQYHPKKSLSHPWMKALLGKDRVIKGDFKHFKKVYQAWEQWQSVGSGASGNFRIAFRLTEPDSDDGAWMLDYLLQAHDDPSLIVDSATVWQARSNILHYLEHRFDNPQEKLLAGLGLASRLFEPIERSLRGAKPAGVGLERDEAFTFLTEAVPLLENSGFGVLVPNWWGKRRRIKAKASFKDISEPSGFLTKDTLLNYEWKMSLGDDSISKEEFEALVALKQPLVRYKGEWVALDTDQIEAAIKFFEQTEDGEVSVLDAIKMGAVTDDDLDGIDIEETEFAGWLSDMFDRLSNPDGALIPDAPTNLKATLRPYQARGFGWLTQMRQMGIGACLADDMGLGKAQPLDAKILTPTGWKCMGEMQVGDAVMNSRGTISHVIGVYPQGEKDIYRVTFRDGSSTECCDDHLWAVNTAVRNRRGNPHQILSLNKIRQKLVDGAGNARHYIPMVQPLHFPERELPLNPYLLGVLLGDGTFTQHGIGLSSADEEIVAQVAERLPEPVSIKKAMGDNYDYHISGGRTSRPNPITVTLREYDLMGCYSHEKFIPHDYLYTALSDRIAVFQGLMDTDGTVREDNTLEFSTTSQQLALDIRELVESFGGRATLRKRRPAYTHNGERRKGRLAWTLIIALPDEILPFRLNRKAEIYRPRPKYPPSRAIKSVEYIGQKAAQCIAVDAPDNLYITDHYILTHNTLQTITLWLHERENQQIEQPALLVCPTSVVGNWRHEIRKFAPTLKTLTHHGADRIQELEAFQDALAGIDVVITSYALMRRDRELLEQIEWSDMVLDEAQNIKNSSAKQSQAARAIPADFKLALTGTPVENRLTELWSILHFLNPGYLGSQKAFKSNFSTPIERYQDESATATLRQITAPFILRRLKTDGNIIQDLPDKFENKVYCTLTSEQATLYEAEVRDSLDAVDNADDKMARRGNILGMLTRLKQICNHPAQFFKEGTDARLQGRSGKLERLTEMLQELRDNGERALIFTQFAEMGHLLRQYLKDMLMDEVLYLHGGTRSKDRDEMVRRFQSEYGPPVFILSLKAGGTGLTLTSANHVFHFDRWYNPAVENQATDRAFRIGQTKDVQVHKYICLGTLEERIDEMIEHKQSLADSVVGAGENWISELNSDELRDLVSLRADVAEVYE